MLFPVTSLLKKWIGDNGATYRISFASIFVRMILVCLTGFIVLLVPKFADLMALVGATCCTLMGFIIPGLCHLKICADKLTQSQRLLDYILVGIKKIFLVCQSLGAKGMLEKFSPFAVMLFSGGKQVTSLLTAGCCQNSPKF